MNNKIPAKALKKNIESRLWKPIWNGLQGYQVLGPRKKQFIVDMGKKSCSYMAWSLSRIPCVHDIAANISRDWIHMK